MGPSAKWKCKPRSKSKRKLLLSSEVLSHRSDGFYLLFNVEILGHWDSCRDKADPPRYLGPHSTIHLILTLLHSCSCGGWRVLPSLGRWENSKRSEQSFKPLVQASVAHWPSPTRHKAMIKLLRISRQQLQSITRQVWELSESRAPCDCFGQMPTKSVL